MPLLPVATNKYHVLAAACLLIAAKFEVSANPSITLLSVYAQEPILF